MKVTKKNFEQLFPVYISFIIERRDKDYPEGTYVETHHILPRCIGGHDDYDNFIALSYRDHARAHYLLAIECLENNVDPELLRKFLSAALLMVNGKNDSKNLDWNEEEVEKIALIRQADAITRKEHFERSPEAKHNLSTKLKNYLDNNPEERERRSKRLIYFNQARLNNPYAMAAYSAKMKALRADPEYKKRQSEKRKALNADPEYKKRQSEKRKAYYANNPEAKAACAARIKAYNATPEAKATSSARIKAYNARPDVKAALIARNKAYYLNNPEEKAVQSKRMKAYFKNNPEAMEKTRERFKINMSTPEAMAKRLETYQDQEYRKKLSERMILYYQNNPEAKEKAIERLKLNAAKPEAKIKKALTLAVRHKRCFSWIPGSEPQ